MKERGFSLLESVVVLIIIGLSVCLVIPSFSRLSKTIELKSTVQKVSSILRYCRSEAVAKGQTYQTIFDLDKKVLMIKSPVLKEKEGYPIPEGIMIKEINIHSTHYDTGSPIIEFYPNGGSSGGTILFSDQRREFKIIIHPLTGAIKVQSSEG